MPLAFQSLNRGVIAFGFFNIHTDLLLLEHYFLFAEDFCQRIIQLNEQKEQDAYEASWEVYTIDCQGHIGDLMGAIHGIHHEGFIGEVYKRFPFPQKDEDFRQKPEGFESRPLVTAMLEKYARKTIIFLKLDRVNRTVSIGEYLFSKEVFQKLIEYVWLGGYPRWKDNLRPHYVLEIKKRIEERPHWLFAGFLLP
ncbi:MAG: hypothetical protein PVG99_09025 [Desulfobacteraceae bacterium]